MTDRKPGPSCVARSAKQGDQCCYCLELLWSPVEVETGQCRICRAGYEGAPPYYRTMMTGRDWPAEPRRL